jgi:hypothetical protein
MSNWVQCPSCKGRGVLGKGENDLCWKCLPCRGGGQVPSPPATVEKPESTDAWEIEREIERRLKR